MVLRLASLARVSGTVAVNTARPLPPKVCAALNVGPPNYAALALNLLAPYGFEKYPYVAQKVNRLIAS